MKNHIFILLINIFMFSYAQAGDFQLHKISQKQFDALTRKINKAIEPDNNKLEILPYDLKQTFMLSNGDKKIGYFVPIKYNSKSYKNTICRLYFLDEFGRIQYVKLFAEKNDNEDIVTSCVNVEAVSIKSNNDDSFDYFTVIRVRLANIYRSTGVVVRFNDKNITYDEKLNSCIQNDQSISSINTIKKRVITCQK